MKNKIVGYFKLIYIFFIIGLESLGNMSAVMAILENQLIKKHKLVEEEDIIDAITLSRIGPGATTANAVAYLGNKIAGFFGGIVAGICYTLGPLIVILVIYNFLEKILEYNFVQSALKGCIIYICVLFLKSTYDMGKNILVNKFNILILTISIIIELIFKISCVYIIIGSIIIGFIKVLFFQKKNKVLLLPCGDK